MIAVMIQPKQSMVGNAIQTHKPSIVQTVFTLPLQPAAITFPLPTAINLRPVTANSLAKTNINAQAGITSHWQNITIAEIVRSLSANGSKNLPKSLT